MFSYNFMLAFIPMFAAYGIFRFFSFYQRIIIFTLIIIGASLVYLLLSVKGRAFTRGLSPSYTSLNNYFKFLFVFMILPIIGGYVLYEIYDVLLILKSRI